MVRDVVTNLQGYTINDVLETDIDDLHAVLSAADEPEKKSGMAPVGSKENPMSLFDFVKSI